MIGTLKSTRFYPYKLFFNFKGVSALEISFDLYKNGKIYHLNYYEWMLVMNERKFKTVPKLKIFQDQSIKYIK